MNPLAPVGPWAGWAPPNLSWCEQKLAAWISTPANTWSNLAYFLVAWLIWRAASSRDFRQLAVAMAAMGAGSFAYHASCTFALQVVDFVGMYAVIWLFIAWNLRRAGVAVGAGAAWTLGVAGCTGVMLGMARLALPYQSLILVLAGVLAVQEFRLWGTDPTADYRALGQAWALLAAALTCSLADLTRVWCDPANHWLQGHAVWHLLSAAGLYRAANYYASLTAMRPLAPSTVTR